MYSKRAGLVIGFHGCDIEVRNHIVANQNAILSPSENAYDWLGNGIYFWENNNTRALKYAQDLKTRPSRAKSSITTPAVLGAIIDLGHCLDLLDSEYLNLLKSGYQILTKLHEIHGLDIPKNKSIDMQGDLLLRNLDCAVIETIHQFNREENLEEFDSVRGVFWEGNELYPNAGFKEKNHIQIAVRNPNCIKGFFIPRDLNEKYPKP